MPVGDVDFFEKLSHASLELESSDVTVRCTEDEWTANGSTPVAVNDGGMAEGGATWKAEGGGAAKGSYVILGGALNRSGLEIEEGALKG
jgi:hypothetical protein